MIEPAPKRPSLQAAAEWIVRALKDESLPVLLCGRSALDYLGEHTGSADIDLLVGTDFQGALSVLRAYVDRGDLFPSGALSEGVFEYLVDGFVPVDVMDVGSVHVNLFEVLRTEASRRIAFGSAGAVDAVTREGYFVLAVMIGLRGFPSKRKTDPMLKVREAWDMFGSRTDVAEVDRLLRKLEAEISFEEALRPPPRKARSRN